MTGSDNKCDAESAKGPGERKCLDRLLTWASEKDVQGGSHWTRL